ncbi:MAG: hypothetical protein MJK13_15975, partial [Pseudomonadales bacterium]|nr:hypothetical protein [Pseudomonadales bacterium]
MHSKNLVNVGSKVIENFTHHPGVSHSEHVVLLLEQGELLFEHGRKITIVPEKSRSPVPVEGGGLGGHQSRPSKGSLKS